jgi:hypothetical protein
MFAEECGFQWALGRMYGPTYDILRSILWEELCAAVKMGWSMVYGWRF